MTTGFPVRIEDVEAAAKNAKLLTEQVRENKFEEEVARIMNRKFFRPKTREDAIEMVTKNSDMFDNWICYGWGTMDTAVELLDACKVCCGDVAYLTSEQAAFVKKWLPK